MWNGRGAFLPALAQTYIAQNFKAQFPIFSKIEVNGPNTDPVFVYLKENTAPTSDL